MKTIDGTRNHTRTMLFFLKSKKVTFRVNKRSRILFD